MEKTEKKGKRKRVEKVAGPSREFDISDDDFQRPAIIPKVRKRTVGSEKVGSATSLVPVSDSVIGSDTSLTTSVSGSVSQSSFNPASRSAVEHSSSSTTASSSISTTTSTFSSVSSSAIPLGSVKKRVITIKSTVQNIWNPIYIPALHDLVNTTNMIVVNTYSFVKYIFLKELNSNNDFDLMNFVNKEFFVEVFMSLVEKQVRDGTSTGKSKLKESIRNYRTLIAKHKNDYCIISKYKPPKLTNSQQIALYECTKIETAYLNNIKAQFTNKLCMFINHICGKKLKASILRKELEAEGYTKEKIKEKVRKDVFEPCNKVKQAFIKKELPPDIILDNNARGTLNLLLSMYDESYKFQKDSIYYDIEARPKNHFKAFFKLQELCEANNLKTFSCFPIRTTFIPSYITIDAKIVNFHILKNKKTMKEDKYETWGKVVNLKKKAFKAQGSDKTLQFQGTLETDGIGVSIVKQNTSTVRKGRINSSEVDEQITKYIESLNQEDINKTIDRCVLIDPGRRDILYCMKESSSTKDKKILKYTKNNRTKCARHFKKLRKKNLPACIKDAIESLSKVEPKSVNLNKFTQYIIARASVKDVMYGYYGNETIKSYQAYFPESIFEFKVDKKCNLYYGSLFIKNIRGYFPQVKEFSKNSQTFAIYLDIMLEQDHVTKRLSSSEKNKLSRLAKKMHFPNQDKNYQGVVSGILEKTQLLPFRKMKFSSKVFYDKDDLNLVRRLNMKFGNNSILILGDWSAPNTKFQEPTRNKGLIKMLKKNGFEVLLMDEFKTSSYCPECETTLEKFKAVKNPRPYKRYLMPTVLCHGLLRCKNLSCLRNNQNKQRVWNRDQVAVLNFLKILKNLRRTGERPVLFSRNKQ